MGIRKTIHSALFPGTTPLSRAAQIVLLLLAGLAAYGNSLQVPFIMDDENIAGLAGKELTDILLHGGARRVVDLTFALNHHLHGLQVFGYHLVNLAIHLAAAVTLYFLAASALTVLRRSFPPHVTDGERELFVERFLPLATALLFVLHPLQTQAVTYIIQRYTSLATLLYLLAALLFVRARTAYDRGGISARTLLLGGGTLAAGLLALGSKQIAATLPLMLLVLEAALFRGRLLGRRFFVAAGVLLLLCALAALIHWQGSSLDDVLYDLHHATAEDPRQSRTAYFLTQTRVVAMYLRLLCLPLGQSFTHDVTLYTTLSAPPVLAALLLHLSLFSAALVLLRTSGGTLRSGDWQRGALQRLAGLGIVWFYCTMAVESSFFPIRDLAFEHRVYLPSAGFFLAVAAALTGLLPGRKAAWPLLAAICLILGGLTVARNHVWNDRLLFWQDTLDMSPGSALAMANLGGEYLDRKMPEKALPLIVRAIEKKPNLDNMVMIYLGRTLQGIGISSNRFTSGEELVKPGSSPLAGGVGYGNLAVWEGIINNNMALAFEYMGDPDKAHDYFRNALWINPSYDRAWYNLGLLSLRRGDRKQFDEALAQLRTLNPSLADALLSSAAQ